jgi:hypothetical protein
MSPFPATRRNGTCTGSLWKSHSRSPSLSSSFKSPKKDGDKDASSIDEAAFALDGVLAEANERQRAHEFCVLVGNTMWSYSDVWAYSKGDSPTVSAAYLYMKNCKSIYSSCCQIGL